MFSEWLDFAPTPFRLALALVTAALFTSLPAGAAITITPTSLPTGAVGEAYNQTLAASGGVSPYTWSITSTTTLVFNVTTCPTGGVVLTQGGLTFSSANSICGPVLNGGLTTNSIPATIDAVVATTGEAFSASSVDVSAVNNAIPQETMTITGDLVGGGTVTQLYTYPGNTTAFTTVPLIGFTNITGIHFSIFATDIQNLVITPPSAPPSVPGALQPGLSLNTSTGAISGTPSGSSPANITFQVRDSTGAVASSQIPLTINAALAQPPAGLPDGVQGVPYNHTLTPSGGVGPYTWSIFSGALPAGLSLNGSNGLISGTPTTPGSASFTLQVADAGTRIGNLTTLNIDPPVAVTSSSAPIGDAGLSYKYNNTVTGGLGPPYTWSISSGTLPQGLVLDPNSGVVAGTPLAAGTANLVFKAADSAGNSALSSTIAMLVNPSLAMTTSSLPNGVQTVTYSQNLVANNGTPPYTWTVTGVLPPGLNLASSGALTGKPTAPGSFAPTFTVTDVLGQQVTKQLAITINPTLVITNTTLSNGVQNIPYLQVITTTGGSGLNTSYTIAGGALPAGILLDPTSGAIAGSARVTGSFSFTVQATDSSTLTASRSYSIQISAFGTVNVQFQGPPNPAAQIGPGAVGAAGDNWNFLTTAGGAFNLNDSLGNASGVKLTFAGDAIRNSGSRNAFCTPSPTALCNLMNGYLAKLSGATANITFNGINPGTVWDMYFYQQIDSGSGREISMTVNGTVTGGTTVVDNANDSTLIPNKNYFTLTAVAGSQGQLSIDYHGTGPDPEADINGIQIRPHLPTLTINQTSVTNGVQGASYTQAFAATGGTATGLVWSISSGALPPGILLKGNAIGGAPTASGTFNFTLQVTDSQNDTATQALSITILPPVSITTLGLAQGVQGVAYAQTLGAAGGFGGYMWSLNGSLPAGLGLAAGTGVISGTPTTPGAPLSITVTATDSAGNFASAVLSVQILPQVAITTTSLPKAVQGTSYTTTLSGSGGIGALTWSFGAGTTAALAGMSIDSNTGVLSGTPNTFGTLTVVVGLRDAQGNSVSKTLNLPIGQQTRETSDIVVSDRGTGQLVRMSSDGSTPLTVCAAGCHGADIAADSAGNIYTHDTTGLYKTTPGGVVTTVLVRAGGAGGVAADGSGNIIFVDNQSDSIYRVTAAGALTTVARFPIPSPGELQHTFVAIDGGGNYIVTSDDAGAVKIYRFTPGGAATTLATFGDMTASGVAVTATGVIEFVNFAAKTLVGFDPLGAPGNSTTISIPTSDPLLYGLAIDPANGNFIVTGGQTGSVNRLTPTGAATTLVSNRIFTGLSGAAIIPALRPLSIPTFSLPSGILGNAYGPAALTANGGSGNYIWAGAGIAPGLFLSTSGLLNGTPAAIGTFAGTFTVTDGLTGLSAATALSVVVAPRIVPLTLSQTASQVSVAVGSGVSASFSASGGTPPYAFSATGLPGGVSVSGSGAVSGSASQPGVFNATVSVFDSGGQSASAPIVITVLGLNISGFPTGLVGTAYSASMNGVGGLQPYSFSATGLPAGLFITGSGAISGTPTVAGTSTVTITVSDAGGARLSGTASITILAAGAPVTIPSGSLPDATANLPYAHSLSATGGKAPYTWAVVSGSSPDGLTFGANGILSGTPTTPGNYSFGAEVKDSSGAAVSTTATISVKAAALSITSRSPLASGMNGVEYPGIQLSASGGISPYKWSLSSGALPAGMTLDSSGTISGTPSAAGDFSPGITATDAGGNKATGAFALTIRPPSADLILSSGSIAFSVTNGADTVPAGQTVTVQSTSVSTQIGYSVQVSPSAPWLTVTNGAATPDSISATLSAAALTLAAGSYSTNIQATCGTGSCTEKAQTVNVTLTVAPAPPRLKVDTDVVSFSTTQTALAPLTGSITLENAGGGSLGIASVVCQAVWCRTGGPPGSIAGGSSATVSVTVDASVVPPGFYRTTVDITSSAGKGSVPVILFIAADSSMTLSSSGGQFVMPVGGAPGNPNGSFLVSVNTTSGVTLTAAAVGGADWLRVNTSGFSASATQPGTVSFSIDATAAGKLAAGAYYGQISVSGAGLTNSPQFFQVVLNVTPATDTAKPDPQPAGLLFLATAGGANPPQQTVTVYTSASGATQFQASAASDAGWLVVSPTLGSTSQTSPTSTSVAANISGLKAGVYTGTVSYAFASSGVRSVNVTLVVSPVAGTAVSVEQSLTAGPVTPLPRTACAPSALASVQTGLVSNFSAATAWPTPLALKVVDNCGGVVTGAQVVTTFTNGDPPLALPLVDPANGLYSGTWTPRKPVASLTINARISAGGFKDLNVQLAGKVTPNAAPLLTPHGTVHAFAPLVGAPLAPGNIAAIYGSNLAIITEVPNVVPLPTDVNGTQVLIGGIKAPIYFTSDGQVNAQIPYELEPNKQYQVIVAANGALSTPDSIQVSAVVPGLAAYADGTVIAEHADGTLINAGSPAKGGEVAVVYLSGLGSTSGGDVTSGGASPGAGDLATPNVTPTVAVGGVSAKIEFVGLTPGLVGLYQMNFDVPTGLTSGDVDIVVTQSGTSSNRVLLPYTP
jgi:uncharacterized protein (TIGR03437 family)